MKIALEQGRATWRYVKGILRAWERKGITSVEEAKSEEKAYLNRNSQSHQAARYTKQRHKEIVPEWFRELKKAKSSENKSKYTAGSETDPVKEAKELEELIRNYVNI